MGLRLKRRWCTVAKKLNIVDIDYVPNPDTESEKLWAFIQEQQTEISEMNATYRKRIVEASQKIKAIRKTCKHEYHKNFETKYTIGYACIHCTKTIYLSK